MIWFSTYPFNLASACFHSRSATEHGRECCRRNARQNGVFAQFATVICISAIVLCKPWSTPSKTEQWDCQHGWWCLWCNCAHLRAELASGFRRTWETYTEHEYAYIDTDSLDKCHHNAGCVRQRLQRVNMVHSVCRIMQHIARRERKFRRTPSYNLQRRWRRQLGPSHVNADAADVSQILWLWWSHGRSISCRLSIWWLLVCSVTIS